MSEQQQQQWVIKKFKKNEIYEGEWLNGKANGKGIYCFKNGDKYKGDWLNNKPNGKGIRYYLKGEKYEGYWLNGKRNGQGIQYNSNGDIKYKGEWLNDKKHGQGIFYHVNGSLIEQNWTNGKRTSDEDIFKLPPESGPCRMYDQRFYFNNVTKKCEHLMYGGCFGNANNFKTIGECLTKCTSTLPAAIINSYLNKNKSYCDLCFNTVPQVFNKTDDKCKSTSTSSSTSVRYFFNPLSKKCEQFIYTGEQQTKNNFKSITECISKCEYSSQCPPIYSLDDQNLNELWKLFKKHYDKNYDNLNDDTERREIFKNNLYKINEHNTLYKNDKISYFIGITMFSDWAFI
jgi:hypothetical protein